jgi:hypothetical protein
LTQDYNAQLVDQFATDFPKRMDSTYAWGQLISGFLLTPGLHAFWSVSSIEIFLGSMIVYDMSAQGRHLHCMTLD